MNKTVLVTMIFLGSNILTNAQESISCDFSITYATTYAQAKDEEKPNEDMMVLQVGPDGKSKFFSYWKEQNNILMDSLMAIYSDPVDAIKESKKKGFPEGQNYKVFKNLPDEGKLTYVESIFDDMYYTEPMQEINWQMEDGDTVIAEYTCQKAMGEWRGRTWTAWFTMDIPVADGPWKLHGLPGLILKATDAENLFSFSCIGIKKESSSTFEFSTKEMEKTTPKKIKELTTLSVQEDIQELLKSTMGIEIGEITGADGNPLKPKKVEVVFIEN